MQQNEIYYLLIPNKFAMNYWYTCLHFTWHKRNKFEGIPLVYTCAWWLDRCSKKFTFWINQLTSLTLPPDENTDSGLNTDCAIYEQTIVWMFCAVRYHLYNSKNVKNTHGGVLLLVKLQAFSLQLYYWK